jgi:hypothetical protein
MEDEAQMGECRECGVDSVGSVQRPVVGSYQHGGKLSGSGATKLVSM